MTTPTQLTDDQHRELAADLFNGTWDLIEKVDRTPAEIDAMIHGAHASRYHWEQVSTHEPKNIATGEWQLSRVYAILKRPEPALWHARRCLEHSETHGLVDFHIVFAHEAMARAYAAGGDKAASDRHFAEAERLGALISEKGERDYLFKDLNGGEWFGFR